MHVIPPDGVFPFFISNEAAEKHGLKTGPAILDLVDRKCFSTTLILIDIKRLGFMCAFEPCGKQLKECNLDEFIVVCDTTSQYGELFLLLYKQKSIDNFLSVPETQNFERKEANKATANETEVADAAKLKQKNVVHVDTPIVSKFYKSSTADATSREIDELNPSFCPPAISCMISLHPDLVNCAINYQNDTETCVNLRPYPTDPVCFVLRHERDVAIQAVPVRNTSSSQTIWHRKENKVTQYKSLNLRDWGIIVDDIWVKVAKFLRSVIPLVEITLLENQVVDIFADYLSVPCNEEIQAISRLEDNENTLKEVYNFVDLSYTKGKIIKSINWNQEAPDVVAVSVCESLTMEENIKSTGIAKSSHIVLWQFGIHTHPKLVLVTPSECHAFKINPSQSHILVAGCMNGQIALFNLSDDIISKTSSFSTRSTDNSNNNDIVTIPHLEPKALTHPEHSHKRMVTDIAWLPPGTQINAKGKLLPKKYLSNLSNQFLTLSGDGTIFFWDIRFEDIMRGKLPYIAKVKGIKNQIQKGNQGTDSQAEVNFPSTIWVPLYKIKVKRLEGTGDLSLSRVCLPNQNESSDQRKSQICCSSEEGEIVKIGWSSKEEKDCTEKQDSAEKSCFAQNFVHWVKPDHMRPCFTMERSNFFPDFILTVSDWNFHIWHIENETEKPLFVSCDGSCFLTGGYWSPTRPAILYIAKSDGCVDIWDFTNSFHGPSSTLSLTPNKITSMAFIITENCENEKKNMLTVSDNLGALKVFELPLNLVKSHPNELKKMNHFLYMDDFSGLHSSLEAESVESTGDRINNDDEKYIHDQSNLFKFEKVGLMELEIVKENNGLSEEEEKVYIEMEKKILG